MPTFDAIRDWVLVLAGNIFIIIFVVRSVGAYGKKEWGELTINLLAAVLLVGLIYFNESFIELLRNVWQLIVG